MIALTDVDLTRLDGIGRLMHKFGEHVLRVSGAQFLIRAGLDVVTVQLFARWGSMVILKYIQEAPLADSAALSKKALATIGLGTAPTINNVAHDITAFKQQLTLQG